MGKLVNPDTMVIRWVGASYNKVYFEWSDVFDKSVSADKLAWTYVTGYKVRFLYRTSTWTRDKQFGWLSSDEIHVDKKDLGWQKPRYNVEWDAPEHTMMVKAQVRIEIDTSAYGEGSLFAAELIYGDFIALWDVANNDGKAWWSESKVLTTTWVHGQPQAPNVELTDDLTMLMSLDYTPSLEDMDADYIQFEICHDKYTEYYLKNPYKRVIAKINYAGETATAGAKVQLLAGKVYYVRARFSIGMNPADGYTASNWGEWSSEIVTKPNPPLKVKNLYSDSESSGVLVCSTVSTATSYTIEWAEDRTYFDTGSSKVGSNTSNTNTIRAEGLTTGKRYYFRVRASNSAGDSDWTYASNSIVLGKKPSPPTTWTYKTSIDVGEKITFFWTHNSEDGSVQKAAQLYLDINGTTRTINVPVDSSLTEDKEYSYDFSTYEYTAGAIVKWKMRTKGILDSWSDWSVERQVKIYAKPTISFTLVTDTSYPIVNNFPIRFHCVCGPNSLVPLSYNLIITANQNYVGTTETGEQITISKGTEVYNKFMSMYDFQGDPYDFYITLYPKDINLSNNIDYECSMQIAMDSGSSAMDTITFFTSFKRDEDLALSLDYAISRNTYSVLLKPAVYDLSDLPEEDPGDDYVPPLSENKIIDIYRRDEVSDEYILIQGNLDNTGSTTIVDPHPSLKSTIYRIVATDTETGSINWDDTTLSLSGIAFPSIIIQWDESVNFIYNEYTTDSLYDAPISGNMLFLPYNIKTTESNDKDISHVEYIGRKRPVSYFGTQLGESASWSCEFDKTDDATILMLRKLARWTDNVYVREPSGMGYWATVSVSFNNDYDSLVIPVTIEVTRVEVDKP